MTTKKRHHYVPKAYLKAFTDATGCVHVCRKDELKKALHVDLDGTGFERCFTPSQHLLVALTTTG